MKIFVQYILMLLLGNLSIISGVSALGNNHENWFSHSKLSMVNEAVELNTTTAKTIQDAKSLEALMDSALYYRTTSPEKSTSFTKQLLPLLNGNDNVDLKIRALIRQGWGHRDLYLFEESVRDFETALDWTAIQ